LKIVWSPDAQSDLRDATEFVARDNRSAADLIEDRILQAVEGLVDHPLKGRTGLRAKTRELVVGRTPYLIVYRLRPSTVEIVRVWHTSRRPYGDPAD